MGAKSEILNVTYEKKYPEVRDVRKQLQKPNLVIALCLFILLLGATLAVNGNGAYAYAAGTKHISDDATGGDCTTIGSWDTATKTCTLSMNVGETIQIDNNGITLDGNGCTVTGSDTYIGDIGIYLPPGRTDVTIKNLNVQQFSYGIYLSYSSGNTLTGNTPSNNNEGIYLYYSSGNTLTGNTVSNNIEGIYLYFSSSNTLAGNSVSASNFGIFLSYSSGNTLTGNTASNNGYGIRVNHSSSNTLASNTASNNVVGISLESSSSNTLTGNTVDSNYENGISLYDSSGNTLTGNIASNNAWGGGRYGIYLLYSSNNEVYNNNFINNWAQAYVAGGSGNVFNLAAPVGGNYWSDYDTAAEGCNDVSPADGFCDAPYVFTGGQDNLPRLPLTPAQAIQNLIGLVNGMNLPSGLANSLTSKLSNAIKSLDKGQITAAINQLNAFINEVSAKSCGATCTVPTQSKPLTGAQASQLIAAAQQIINALL